MKKISLLKLHKLYIQGTEEKAPVVLQTILLCNATNAVMKAINLTSPKIHTTTKMIKHLYDSKPAEEYEFILHLHNLVSIIKYPDEIYENKNSKRGQFAFIKTIKDFKYLSSLETTVITLPERTTEEMNFAVTAFRIRKESYLQNYKLLWNWKGDISSS